jgi:hypothetical protein
VKANASWGCEFCQAIAATLRIGSPFYDQYEHASLQISLPHVKAHGNFRFIHLKWKRGKAWERLPIPMAENESKLNITQVFHPFGAAGE